MSDGGGFLHRAEHRPAANAIAVLDRRHERPQTIAIQRGHVLALLQKVAFDLRQPQQRTLQPVEHAAEQARAQLDLERPARGKHGRPGREPGGVFVHLQCLPFAPQAR